MNLYTAIIILAMRRFKPKRLSVQLKIFCDLVDLELPQGLIEIANEYNQLTHVSII
jgi:hypothetical protein